MRTQWTVYPAGDRGRVRRFARRETAREYARRQARYTMRVHVVVESLKGQRRHKT